MEALKAEVLLRGDAYHAGEETGELTFTDADLGGDVGDMGIGRMAASIGEGAADATDVEGVDGGRREPTKEEGVHQGEAGFVIPGRSNELLQPKQVGIVQVLQRHDVAADVAHRPTQQHVSADGGEVNADNVNRTRRNDVLVMHQLPTHATAHRSYPIVYHSLPPIEAEAYLSVGQDTLHTGWLVVIGSKIHLDVWSQTSIRQTGVEMNQ